MKKLVYVVTFIVLALLWTVAVFGADPEPPTIPNPVEGWGLYVQHTGDPLTVAWDANSETNVTGYEMVVYNMESQSFIIRGTTPQAASPSLTVTPTRYGHHIFYVRSVDDNATDEINKYSTWANSVDAQFTQDGKLFWVYAYIAPPTQLEIEGHESTQPVLSFEAEDGQIVAPMVIGNDANASGGQFVSVPGSNQQDGNGTVTFIFTVTEPGDYVLRAETIAPSGSQDSFFIDYNGNQYLWDVAVSTTWITDTISHRGGLPVGEAESDPLVFTLPVGEHTITLRERESGTQIDKIRLERL